MTASFTPNEAPRFIQIDEDGYFSMDGLRVSDSETGRSWLASIQHDPKEFLVWTVIEQHDVIVEAFDAPYIVLNISRDGPTWSATMPYGHQENFALTSLTLDEWDRFHGHTERGIPFVMSRSAQAGFFDSLDSYDDDSITADGETLLMQPWLPAASETEIEFWSEQYQTNATPWDLNGPHPSLPQLAAQVKLQRSRILVLGCGRAHDAAWLARAGHIVTALDFSEPAIREARELYGHISDLTLVQGDALHLPEKYHQAFDVIFDHTFYCAIDPLKRNDLVKSWRRALVDNGHLFAIFFCNEKRFGPPYGGSEWELRSRFNRLFRPLFWQRLKSSPVGQVARQGSELFVYSQKLAKLL